MLLVTICFESSSYRPWSKSNNQQMLISVLLDRHTAPPTMSTRCLTAHKVEHQDSWKGEPVHECLSLGVDETPRIKAMSLPLSRSSGNRARGACRYLESVIAPLTAVKSSPAKISDATTTFTAKISCSAMEMNPNGNVISASSSWTLPRRRIAITPFCCLDIPGFSPYLYPYLYTNHLENLSSHYLAPLVSSYQITISYI